MSLCDQNSSGSNPAMASKWLRVSLWLVDRLYLFAREICRRLDLNDAISRCYGLGLTETGGRFDDPSNCPEADGQAQHGSGNRKTDVLAHSSLLLSPLSRLEAKSACCQ